MNDDIQLVQMVKTPSLGVGTETNTPQFFMRPNPGVLLVVEGLHDIEFLRRISRILHGTDASIPDLDHLEQSASLIFVPVGGGNLRHWSHRFSALDWREFHLYDRETEPETKCREEVARAVNARPGCHAVLTTKRSLENYLCSAAIEEALGVRIRFSDHDSVADLVARTHLPVSCYWGDLSRRAQNRLRYRIKKSLNADAVERMTAARLAERDPHGELVSWLRTIGRLARCPSLD